MHACTQLLWRADPQSQDCANVRHIPGKLHLAFEDVGRCLEDVGEMQVNHAKMLKHYEQQQTYRSLDMRMPTAVARFKSRTASFCLAVEAGRLADRCMA